MPETNIFAVVVIIVAILSLLFTFARCGLRRELFLLQPLLQQHTGQVENLKGCGEVVILFVFVALSFCTGLLGSQVSACA